LLSRFYKSLIFYFSNSFYYCSIHLSSFCYFWTKILYFYLNSSYLCCKIYIYNFCLLYKFIEFWIYWFDGIILCTTGYM